MKNVGVKWLVELYEHLCANPNHTLNGCIASNILQSIDAGKPVVGSAATQQAQESDGIEDDYKSGESDTDSSKDDGM